MSWIVDDDGRRVEHNNDTCATCAFLPHRTETKDESSMSDRDDQGDCDV